jgi:hypothetical protein
MEQIAGGFNESARLLLAEDDGEPPRSFGIRQVFVRVRSPQCSHKEEAQRGRVQADGARFQLSLFEQIRLVAADLGGSKLFGTLIEVLGEIANNLQIRTCCSLGVITTLEFLQHHFA